MTTQLTPEQLAKQRKSRRTLLLIFLVAVAPVVAGYATFFFWQPSAGVNYGDLVQPARHVDWASMRSPQGVAIDAKLLQAHWVLAYVGDGPCAEACEQALYYARQVRTAQAKKVDRVARVWLLPEGQTPSPALLEQHPGLVLGSITPNFAGEAGRVVLVDPDGNLIMRFPAEIDPKGMIRDLQRLLKYSRLG